jgi:hypothetical protein
MAAYLIVRAQVEPSIHDAFDTWYQNEHLPDAFKAFQAFQARGAKRGWRRLDADVHIAFYEFPDLAAAEALMASDILKGLVAEFDRHWGDKAPRTREIVEISQTI